GIDRKPRYDNTRDIHLADQYYEKEYNDEEYTSEEYYEEDEYEVNLNTSKFQNPPKITVEELEMEEPTPEPVIELVRIEKH
ncbi:13237_t:CDS:2, partial [Funneliformis caledonium]